MRTTIALTLACLSLGAGATAATPPLAADGGGCAEFVRALASPECSQRTQALQAYFRSTGDRVEALRREAAHASASVRARAEVLIAALVEKDISRERFMRDDWPQRFTQAVQKPDPAARTAALEATAGQLLAIVRNPAEPVYYRFGAASALAYFAARIDRAQEPRWVQALPELLQAPDPRSRLIGALLVAQGRLRQEQAPASGRVIPALIAGLRGPTFQERYDAWEALVTLTGLASEAYCVDPLDSPDLRAQGIAAWEAWWEANRDSLAPTRIPGKW